MLAEVTDQHVTDYMLWLAKLGNKKSLEEVAKHVLPAQEKLLDLISFA
jgi:hypothetical protein